MDQSETEVLKENTGSRDDSDPKHIESIDEDLLDQFRMYEDNTVTDSATVLASILVDYEDDVTPTTVQDSIFSLLTEKLNIPSGEAKSRLVESSRDLIAREYTGTHAFILIELPDGSVFVDRIYSPSDKSLDTPEVRRYHQFVDQYGSLSLLSQLEGEIIPVSYNQNRWQIRLSDRVDTDTAESRFSWTTLAHVFGAVAVGGLLTYSLLVTVELPTTPIFGAITVRSLLLTSLLVLFVALAVDLTRTSFQVLE